MGKTIAEKILAGEEADGDAEEAAGGMADRVAPCRARLSEADVLGGDGDRDLLRLTHGRGQERDDAGPMLEVDTSALGRNGEAKLVVDGIETGPEENERGFVVLGESRHPCGEQVRVRDGLLGVRYETDGLRITFANRRFGVDGWSVDRVMRQIPDHFHAHSRDTGWWNRRFRS